MTFSDDRKEHKNYPPQCRQDRIEFILLITGGKGKRQKQHYLLCNMQSQRTTKLSLVLESHYYTWTTKTLTSVFFSADISQVFNTYLT